MEREKKEEAKKNRRCVGVVGGDAAKLTGRERFIDPPTKKGLWEAVGGVWEVWEGCVGSG